VVEYGGGLERLREGAWPALPRAARGLHALRHNPRRCASHVTCHHGGH
jgi:hypothetical protein